MTPKIERERGGSDAEIVLLVSTHAKAAHFVPAIRAALTETWPGHPALRFVTDGGTAGNDVIQATTGTYVPLMAEALADIRKQFPKATHVFHMLEDHCPLRRCDVGCVEAVARLCTSSQLAAVCFVTYEWPWTAQESELVDYGKLYGLPRVDTVDMAGIRLGTIPKSFYRYFQVQPTIWRIDYLEQVLRNAIAADVVDPWAFEGFRWNGAEQHYVAQYEWPTVHHGFLVKGNANLAAIEFADRVAAKDLLQVLCDEARRSMGRIAFSLRRMKGALLGRIWR